MTDTATLQARLDEVEEALHALQTGTRVVSISHDGKSVNYSPASIGTLRAYRHELRRKLGQCPPVGPIATRL